MPFADSNGVKIRHRVEDDGPTLVMQHGYTSSIVIWRLYGYVDLPKNRYRY
ncbi:MAG: hypothetical protein QGG34_09115 [SAR202 cluster bacterium]|jgi:pimeloyl-ACP methyl ester carboxylesterase|nr:hypothetical protein [SAR202 cluster bacterium]MDP6302291.1 hypothetical protein [SAR202 cluster bacterium]MDP7226113.1 hypothetical protein [SAR202 cluster bacterium]MDP7412854.1 hypothetical protein [SAR202 cluster bacterium]|tara:strand:+ start:3129 stop:3281 length:153 start_codon:yes stop_codon:yes gene_type:complete